MVGLALGDDVGLLLGDRLVVRPFVGPLVNSMGNSLEDRMIFFNFNFQESFRGSIHGIETWEHSLDSKRGSIHWMRAFVGASIRGDKK